MTDDRAPLDHEVLRAIARTLRTDDRVDAVVVERGERPGEHERLVVTMDAARFPDTVRDSRLEIQWYRNDDFNVHYVEDHADGTVWQCRWDHQSTAHSARGHFHPPPDAGNPVDVAFPDDYRDVIAAIMGAVRERIEALWR